MSSHSPAANQALIARFRTIVGKAHVLTRDGSTKRYRSGFRFGSGPVVAVVRPGTLVQQWQLLLACADAGTIVIMQAANTGLTGGSTPDGDDYDRGVVIINTMRITGIYLIDEGRQVVCLPGATLSQLEQKLRPIQREPHSVIGSSCIGASVLGGVCNNSGGSLINRGPAYTQLAVFAQMDARGELHLVNHIGIRLGNDPAAILEKLDRGDFTEADIEHDPGRAASDRDYTNHVRDLDARTPARFNADPKRLFEASGSAGKIILFAVRLDSFPKEENTAIFYIGTNDTADLTELRRHMLRNVESLPVSAEYMHRTAFDIAERYGKDTFLAIRYLGTDRLPAFFALKGKLDAIMDRLRLVPSGFSDRALQAVSNLFPGHLPKRMKLYRDLYAHHLILKMSGSGVDEARAYLESKFRSDGRAFFECTPGEGETAFRHRFAAAGAAVRYRAIHRSEVEDIVALDIALPRNERNWFESLPDDISANILHSLYYGHFFCHVFHQDYIVAKGQDPIALEERMWAILDRRGAEYPAEHNVGHLYHAKPALLEHYRTLDPCNAFNPGIGRTSKCAHWR